MVAMLALGLWAHLFGGGLQGTSFPWLFWGGVIGFGLGDMALFGALTRIGPRLAILLTQCLAAPLAAVIEWRWLGAELSVKEGLCAACILAGVALALAPDRGWEGKRSTFWWGVLCGALSAAGQGLGAVFTRKAYRVAEAAHFHLDGGTAAYQRIIGGVLMTWVGFLALRRWQRAEQPLTAEVWKKAAPSVMGNALAGPALGVACFQWALLDTRSGIVLPIVATSPLVTMLLAWGLEGTRPTRRACAGGVLAVLGAATLSFVRAGR